MGNELFLGLGQADCGESSRLPCPFETKTETSAPLFYSRKGDPHDSSCAFPAAGRPASPFSLGLAVFHGGVTTQTVRGIASGDGAHGARVGTGQDTHI